jgi:hypothetical protein
VRQEVVSYEEAHKDPVVHSPLEVVGERQVRHLQVSPVTIVIEFNNTKIAPKQLAVVTTPTDRKSRTAAVESSSGASRPGEASSGNRTSFQLVSDPDPDPV